MGRAQEYREALRRLPAEQWAAYLDHHSGLPGPRANLALLQAAGDEGDAAAVALEACSTVTGSFVARPLSQRRNEAVRVLRQALGYCWSVAVAADPTTGVPRFETLIAVPDPDVAWIVRQNAEKARLKTVLGG